MNIETIRARLHEAPFKPFWIYLSDGGRIPVEHEDFVAVNPNGGELLVYLPDGRSQCVDTYLITRLEVRPPNGKPRRKSK